jgi:hypothetical protein
MHRPRLLSLGLSIVLIAVCRPARADSQALTARIDQYFAARWSTAGVEPAPIADDAEYLRRTYLDLAGRIPSVGELRVFLRDKSPERRQHLVERLLEQPRYVVHFTNVWRSRLLPEANANFQARFVVPGFEAWLRGQLDQNAGYDQIVRALLTAPVDVDPNQRNNPLGMQSEATPLGFYVAKEFKPENLAASTARIFLGVRVECAQCHNHPFASWKRDQFWSYAAFFSGIRAQNQGDFVTPAGENPEKKELTIPGTDRVVQARFLNGVEPKFKAKVSARTTLADWMTAADNPYFARAAVNRLWFYFFGTGLVEPVDDMIGSGSNSANAELLDELARAFAAEGFDLKSLIRAITASKPYQLSSAPHPGSKDDPHQFAHMAVRGLSAEQLFDSVAQATGYQEAAPANPNAFPGTNNSPRAEFLAKFANQGDRPAEAQTSILQALALMNGKLLADATTLERSETLAAVADAPFLSTEERIETLFLATLSRKPKPKELSRLVRHVESGGVDDNPNQALADVFWVLLNSGEFMVNH